MKNLNYVIRQLSKDDPDFTINLLLEIIREMEDELDRTECTVNSLNREKKELEEKLKTATNFEIKIGKSEVWF